MKSIESQAKSLFDSLFAKIPQNNFAYIWTKQGGIFSFAIADESQREDMAKKAVELSVAGGDVWHCVNPVCVEPTSTKRGDEKAVSYQTACLVDIDISSTAHKSKNLVANFEEAKSLLPFPPSIIINSGYGLHSYYIWAEPIAITDQNREEIKRRNKLLLDVIKARANGKDIDNVGDLPRILRTPGTFNYKLGKDNPPLCHIVEDSGLRFSPADFDDTLNALIKTTNTAQKTPPRGYRASYDALGNDYDLFRAKIMLDAINPAVLPYSEWLAVISAAKNIGLSYPEIDAFNRRDGDRYNEKENQRHFDSLSDSSFDIETLHGIAKRFAYDEKDARRQWYAQNPSAQIQDDKEKFTWTQDKIKSCPVNLRLPDNYLFNSKSIKLIVPPKKENEKPKYICAARTPIIPTKIFREPSANKFSYEIAILIRGVWRTTEIEGRALADPRAIITLADSGALIDEPKIICRFLNAVISSNSDLAEIKAYNRTGWTDDTFTNFAYPAIDDSIIRRAGFDFKRDLATRGNAELWKKKFIEVMDKGGAVAHAYIGTALTAILARPLNIINPQCHLQGTSGTGKTALQKFTASIFGNPRELMRNFAATNKNRQLVADAFCDLPSFFDELETIQGKAAEENLSNDVYNFADGKGNQANKRDGTARETFRFGGARLTTGERPLLKQNDLRGAYKRLLQFTLREKIFEDDFATDLHIFSESNFGNYALPWIKFAKEHLQKIQDKYQQFAKSDPTTVQYEPTHLKLLSASLVAVEFFKVMLGINAEFDTTTLIRIRRILLDTQLPTLAELDDTARAIEFLQSFVAGNYKYFIREVDKPEFDNESGANTPTCYGKIFENGEVAFLPHAFKKILEIEGGFKSADKLRNEFCAKGYLRHTAGKTTCPMWFNGKTTKMILFNSGVVSSSQCDTADNKLSMISITPYYP